ncbi:hypothetical protein [Enterococcus raffinosus]|uniref:hypothetical protein n=1 Tax=Enterococcus raffinosus TaxID=71452 RepID=UPI003AD01F44
MKKFIFWTEFTLVGTGLGYPTKKYVTKNPNRNELAQMEEYDDRLNDLLGYDNDAEKAIEFNENDFNELRKVSPFNRFNFREVN